MSENAGRLAAVFLALLLTACGGGGKGSGQPGGDPGGGDDGSGEVVTVRAVAEPSLAEAESGARVWLDASDSRGDALLHDWEQLAGPEVHLAAPGDAVTHFTAPEVGEATPLAFRLRVTDAAGNTDSTELTLTVTPPVPLTWPGLADVCNLLGDMASPLCGGLGTLTGLLLAGCAQFAPAAFCSLFGGNLHAVIDGCHAAAPGEAAAFCKLLDQVLTAGSVVCRQLMVPAPVCALLAGVQVGEAEISAFEQGPLARALALQRGLGDSLPLRDAEYLSTHNSFNSSINDFPITVSGSDFNQRYGIVDQLRMGVRGIELDVHWWFSIEGRPDTAFRAPVLCHGNANHLGCTTERSLRTDLLKIRDWLLAHPGEIIVIDMENRLNEDIDDSALAHEVSGAVLRDVLGDLLFRPADLGRSCEDGFPVELSTADIRASGRQVVIYSGCGEGEVWPQQVWQRKRHTQSSISGLGDAAIRYPDQCVFSAEAFRDDWTRIYEDATLVGLLTGAARQTTADEVREMLRCGVNMPSFDLLTPQDPRLDAFLWSWLPGEPSDASGADCARHRIDGRFDAATCAMALPPACVNPADPADWRLGAPARWSQVTCPQGYVFGVPRNSPQNEALKAAKQAAGVTRAWLGYARTAEGWQAPD